MVGETGVTECGIPPRTSEALLELLEFLAKRNQIAFPLRDFVMDVSEAPKDIGRVGVVVRTAHGQGKRFVRAQPVADRQGGDTELLGCGSNAASSAGSVHLPDMIQDLRLFRLGIPLPFGLGFWFAAHRSGGD